MKSKKIYTAVLAVLTAVLAVCAFALAFHMSARSAARKELQTEISQLRSETASINEEKVELTNTINNLDADLGTKETINQYYVEYKKSNDALKESVNTLKKQSDELDDKIRTKREELSIYSGLDTDTRGKSYSIKADETYSCPDKIGEGRYVVTGKGTFIIYSASGGARVSENLDVAYNNSYTFELKKGEKIKSTAGATITELN